jgi:hypothetical protein
MVGLYAKASKKVDLSHFWQQHILWVPIIRGGTAKDIIP